MLDRTVAPRAKSLDKIHFADFDRTPLSAGRPILQIKDDAQPVFYLELIFEGGRSSEAIPGASWYASKIVQEGTRSLTSHDISLKFESLGSFIDITAGMDYVSYRIYSLTKNIDATIELLKDILLNPSFPADEYELLKQIRVSNINNLMAKNSQFANLAFTEKIFGSDAAYGKIITAEVAGAVTLKETIDQYKKRTFANPYVILMGDYDDKALNKVDNLISTLKTNTGNTSTTKFQTTSGRFDIEKSDSTQASIRTGCMTINKDHSDIHDLTIANVMLGGFFGSRLMKTIREEKGLTYGIYSGISHMMKSSYWQISAEVQKEKMDEALDAIQIEINRLATTAPSESELSTLKSYMFGKLQNSMDSIFSIGNLYKSLLINDKDLSYIQSYVDRVLSISAEEISEATNKYLKDKNEVTLLVS